MRIFNAKKLSERQKTLVKHLEANQNYWQLQEEIASEISDYFTNYSMGFHDTNERKIMTKDINYINHSPYVDKIVLSSAKGIKLATEEEAIKFVKRKYREAFNLLRYARVLEKKVLKDNQTVLNSQDLSTKVIDAFIDKTKGEEE